MVLQDTQIEEFENAGVVLMRGVFADWVETLRRGVEKNMRDPGPWGREYNQPGEPGRFFGDYCNWHRIDEYHDFIFNSPAAALAAQLMQSSKAHISRACIGERTRNREDYTLASRPALLLRRRPAGLQHVDSTGPGTD